MNDGLIEDLKVDPWPMDLEGFEPLAELALDLRSSWHHGADVLWRQLDAELWKATRNPWVVLQTVSRDVLERHLAQPLFCQRIDELLKAKREAQRNIAWFEQMHDPSAVSSIAYFSMEFMLSEALPIYSGGLGNVAGDQLKAANDLGVPIVGIGLLYQQGYFRQLIGPDGNQIAVYPYNDPGQLPVVPLRRRDGQWLRLRLALPGHPIWIRCWQAQVGRLRLLLLDTNDVGNFPPYRAITSELYGGGSDMRLMQEMVLGIGGWRLLRALDRQPEVCHLNEGHAAFTVLERARSFMADTGRSFSVALAATRVGNLFTTHTAVPAGFDCFAPDQIERYLGDYCEGELGVPRRGLLGLGRQNPDDDAEAFNMAYLAIRGSGAVNAVSRLHEEVSRRLFAPLFPRWPLHEIPVGHVTNGVHVPTWDSAPADTLWTKVCGQNRWLGTMESTGHDFCCVSDADLWAFRRDVSRAFVAFVREQVLAGNPASDTAAVATENTDNLLDPDVLTIGFARRFASYKRPDLLLADPARLLKLLGNAERPIQLVIAGKAHPADSAGRALIQRWVTFAGTPGARHRVVFLSDYDMHLAEHLVQGVDVWLNTPRRPWEASGTSGMKVLVNGGINVSVLDGWWAEAYSPDVGWALDSFNETNDQTLIDQRDADALYKLLEQQIIPEFYERDDDGIPRAWVARMRRSMSELTPQFSTNRSVREYAERYYLPAAAALRVRTAHQGELAAQIDRWQERVNSQWSKLEISYVQWQTVHGEHCFDAEVYLGELQPDELIVELYADSKDGDAIQVEMDHAGAPEEVSGAHRFKAIVTNSRPAGDYTVRIRPHQANMSLPLEVNQILWYR